MRGRRAASASSTRLNAAATRFFAAMTSGRRSSSSHGNPAGTVAGSAPNSNGAVSGCGIPAEQDLERAQGLLERELNLSNPVAIGLQIDAREVTSNSLPMPTCSGCSARSRSLVRIHHLGEHRLLKRGFDRKEP